MLNIKVNTKKKIKQILKKIGKKNIKTCKIYHINHYEKLPSTDYCSGLILKAMKNYYDQNNEPIAVN